VAEDRINATKKALDVILIRPLRKPNLPRPKMEELAPKAATAVLSAPSIAKVLDASEMVMVEVDICIWVTVNVLPPDRVVVDDE
jgi:hypothetical protein